MINVCQQIITQLEKMSALTSEELRRAKDGKRYPDMDYLQGEINGFDRAINIVRGMEPGK